MASKWAFRFLCDNHRDSLSTSLRIDDDGVHQDGWKPFQRKIKWTDVVAAEFNTGDQSLTVVGRGGKKVVHRGHVAREQFLHEIQNRTKIPLTIVKPGLYKMNKTIVPYSEAKNEAEQDA
jgi:hypothetical protein